MKKSKAKKGLLIAVSVILAIVIVLTVAGPYLVLGGARQGEVEAEYSYSEYFFTTYEEVRENLEKRVEKLRAGGVTVEVSEYAVNESE